MKYLISIIVAFGMFSLPLFLPLQAYAANEGCRDLEQSINTYGVSNEVPDLPKYCSVGELSQKFLNIAFALIGSTTIIFIIIGGYTYMTARGNEEAAQKGRKTLLYALAGLAVVILSTLLVNIIVGLLLNGL